MIGCSQTEWQLLCRGYPECPFSLRRAKVLGLESTWTGIVQSGTGAASSSTMSYVTCMGMSKASRASATPVGTKEDIYWFCRRSLRMWPVAGDDLRKGLLVFLKSKLQLDSAFFLDMGEISVKKVYAGPRAKIRDEVIAVFSTVAVRDNVRRAAKELRGCPDSGIRLEIPALLQPSLKALETVSFKLKKKYPEMKRNIKFDDDVMDLVLDLCTDPINSIWEKVRPEQAKILKGKLDVRDGRMEEVTGDELGRMIDDVPEKSSSTAGT